MDKEQIQSMIHQAIRKHEIRVAYISGFIGGVMLLFYTHGVITLVRG